MDSDQASDGVVVDGTATDGAVGKAAGEMMNPRLPVLAAEVIDAGGALAADQPIAYQPIVANVPIHIRPGTIADLAFIDGLQKQYRKALGFLPTQAILGKIERGEVLIAEGSGYRGQGTDEEGSGDRGQGTGEENAQASLSSLTPDPLPLTPVEFLIASDRYFKRDEVGYVTQLCVVPEYRRSLVAAQLLQAQFDRSAYGCRLYSCWCAQDLKANEFWEAMGFTAIAFRSGGVRGQGSGEEIRIRRTLRLRLH